MTSNPFLVNEIDSSANDAGGFSNFNPFVSATSDSQPPVSSSNPFFEFVAAAERNQPDVSGIVDSGTTNPFAAFFTSQASSPVSELERATVNTGIGVFENTSVVQTTSSFTGPTVNNKPDGKSSNVDLLDDIFGAAPSSYQQTAVPVTFNHTSVVQQDDASSLTRGATTADARRQSLDTSSSVPDIPRFNVDARRKSDVLWSNVELEKRSSGKVPPARPEPPRRPPPPRPGPPLPPPPSKETQDLILSVTGTLEATSSDLLDRLQATRTPSPTPISELHSPSPTHLNESDDLLGESTDHFAESEFGVFTTHDIVSGKTSLPPPTTTSPRPIMIQQQQQTSAVQLSHQDDFDVFHAIANLPKADDIDEQLKQQQQQQQSKVCMPPRPPPPAQSSSSSSQSTAFTDLFDSPAPIETVHNVTPFDTSKPFPGQTSMIFQQIDENDGQIVLEALSRKSSLLSGGPPSSPELETLPTIASSSAAGQEQQSSFLSQSSSAENISISGGIVTASFIKPTELTLTDDKFVRTRKASHDITAEKIQIIPTRKKYSLDYSSSVVTGSTAGGFFEGTNVMDDEILEVPKFPAGMSTTPIISCENIDNEALFEQQEKPNDFFATTAIISEPTTQYDVFSQQSQQFEPLQRQQQQQLLQQVQITGTDPFGNDLLGSPQLAADASRLPPKTADDFDAFEAKFESVKADTATASVKSADPFDPFGTGATDLLSGASDDNVHIAGFGNEEPFDEFLAMRQPSNAIITEAAMPFTSDSWPGEQQNAMLESTARIYQEAATTSKVNFFEQLQDNITPKEQLNLKLQTDGAEKMQRIESEETPPTPLFDEDISQPLEPFPRTIYDGPGWEMQIRYPIRKKFTGQRFWKKVFVRLVYQGETPHLELLNRDDGKETVLHEWPLQPCYAISEIGAQQYDQYGKIFTLKIQFVVYKERPGVRPGQVTKAERLTNKLSQFAAYAIQGDYQGVKEFGSDLKKLGLPVEHSPQISLICKLGSHNYEDMKQFSSCVEEALFRLPAHRDNIHINYKMEEVQITAVDELYVEQNSRGGVSKQIARVRLFFLGFLTGMPDIDVGINDLWRQGKEVVGRHDIIPVVTEEWIRLENIEFHSCVQPEVYEEARTIRFKPPDACYFELMRFRVRPPKNRELPVQLKTTFRITGNKVDIFADIIVPGFTSRKLGQIPCEDVVVRIPIPECWIYLFRVEKHFRYGSVKSAHRRTGKIKGIERFLGAVENLEPHLIEVTSGHAKYEHHHRSIVWRMSRLPKEGQGAYTTHNLACHLALTSFDQIPEELAKYCFVEFTMPIAQVSHTTVRSVSITNSDSDNPPEKCVRHLARHEYRVEIEHTHAEDMADYVAATITKPLPRVAEKERPPSTDPERQNSDSDSSG